MKRSTLVLATVALSVFSTVVSTQTPRFYDDDPIASEPEPQDASNAQPYSIQQLYEQMYDLFVVSRHEPSGTRAQNINTIDEVPDSSWFTNRIDTTVLTSEEIARGPNVGAPPDPSKWIVIREKTSGVHPGLHGAGCQGRDLVPSVRPAVLSRKGRRPRSRSPRRSSGRWATTRSNRTLTTFDPKRVEFDPTATLRRPSGQRTPFTWDDINQILERVARRPDGTYRVVAGRLVPGKILGNFLYDGTRPDDPNDIVPHEHRRELRALRVFGAWTNLTDWKAANTLDALATQNGRTVVKHYLQDVGSTFGMNNDLHEWDLSYEHFYEGGSTAKRFFSFGFALSPWQTIDYVEYPSVGKFEGDRFDPRAWRPQIPTRAYIEFRDDDGFWAARRVAAFTDDQIRAAVHTGEFSDAVAEKHLADVLIKRRDKIASVYLTAVNPIVAPRLDASNRLTFENAAVTANVAKGATTYRASWSSFDNATGQTRPFGETEATTTTLTAPAGLPTGAGSFIEVAISAANPAYPEWKQPVRTHFRRLNDGWKLVGLERLPHTLPAGSK